VNIAYVLRQLGILYIVLGALMAGVACFDALDWMHTGTARSLMPSLEALLSGALGAAALGAGLFYWFGRKSRDTLFGRREALLLVALGWLGGAALAAVPFWVWGRWTTVAVQSHPFGSFASCYFEAMSGLTTTGSTVLAEVESLPRSLLLWRSLTHWVGGLGIVVLFVAVYSSLGVGGRKLFQFESSGRVGYDVIPQIRQTARLLWLVYLGLTVMEVLLLLVFGLGLFDAVCETFGTIASGGFSTRTASIAGYHSLGAEIVIIVFMVLTGVNYGLFLLVLHGRWRQATRDPELRWYLGSLLIGGAIVSATLIGKVIVTSAGQQVQGTIPQALRYGFFQLTSIRTNTGFATADFDGWGFVSTATLLVLMFMGASAGSTGGGVKVIRCLVAFKVLAAQVERIFRPHVVRVIKVGGENIDAPMRLDAVAFIMMFLASWLIGSFLVMAIEQRMPADPTAPAIDFTTAATACAATINTTGPGFARVGAIMNFGWFSAPSKILLSLLMVLGRLEIYAILVLFMPSYWRSE
jgi:trk system potassium uptake protein TrkH